MKYPLMMPARILVSLFSVLVMQSTYWQIAAEDALQKKTSTFYDKNRGFKFRFPAGWDVENLGAPVEGRWDLLLKSNHNNNRVLIHFTWFQSKDIQKIYAEEKERYFKHESTTIIEENQSTVRTYPAHTISARFDDNEIRFMKMIIITGSAFPDNKKTVRFSIALQKEAPELLNFLETCIQSIELY